MIPQLFKGMCFQQGLSETAGTQKGPHTQHHVHVFQPSDSQAEGNNKDII